MALDPAAPLRLIAPATAAAFLLLGCAAPTLPPAPPPPIVVVPPAPAPAPVPAPAPAPPAPRAESSESPVAAVLAYAERVRSLAQPEAAVELSRLSGQEATPVQQFQMALLLLQTRGAGETARALQFLQRVQSHDSRDGRDLNLLARQVAAQALEQRRLEEQMERQSQQLRDAQRRADQLQDRLEALRALERARPNRPTP
jgi:hypothetical protein